MFGFDGIGLSLYRSFGPEIQRIGPFGRINLLIGQNNVGKSNILNFISKHYPAFVLSAQGKNTQFNFSPLDKHDGTESTNIKFELGLSLNGAMHNELIKTRFDDEAMHLRPLVEKILKSKTLTGSMSVAWFPYIANWGGGPQLERAIIKSLISENLATQNQWYTLWAHLTHQQNGSLEQHCGLLPVSKTPS